MGDVMSSWARTLVPTAVAAAAIAGFMLVRAPANDRQQVVSVEELLTSDVEGETIPVTLGEDDTESAVAFASEIF
jgi:copper(I)-binding protein